MMLLSSCLVGLVFGSFLNVVVYRLKARRGMIFGGSFCLQCETKLAKRDLIPLLSFALLKGKCRHCGGKISRQYPIVEALSGFLWAGSFYKIYGYGLTAYNGAPAGEKFAVFDIGSILNFQFVSFLYYVFILSAFLVIAVYDFKWRIIPDKIVFPAAAAAIFYNIFESLKFADFYIFLSSLLTAVVIFLFFFILFYFSDGKAMGLGDAKLAFLIGLFLSPLAALFAVALAFVVGAVFGIIMMRFGGKTLKSKIAFGPFLVFGAAVAFFFPNLLNLFIN